MTVHCGKCNHQWTLPFRLPMPIKRAVAAMRGFVAAGCPKCGAHGRDVICGAAQSGAPASTGVAICVEVDA